MKASQVKKGWRRSACAAIVGLAMLVLPAAAPAGQVPPGSPEDVGLSSERLERIGEAMERHIEAGNITGAVTLVARGGRIAHFEAHGLMDLDSETPMRKDAAFRIMSMTKPIMAVAVLMMLEEGKIGLADPVSKFLPEFAEMQVGGASGDAGSADGGSGAAADPETVAANREITIRDLLTHTSGIVRNAERTPDDSLATYVPKLAKIPLEFQPGTDWQYSGLAGPDVLARIVELVSGQAFDQFLRGRIFDPLGMRDTMYFPSDELRPRLVTLYRITEQGFEKDPDPDRISSKVYFSGGAGLVSTAHDYLQFAQMLANGGELNGKRLLSPRTVELMASDHVDGLFDGKLGFPERGFGFGLQVAIVEDHVRAGWRLTDGSFGWLGAYGTQVWINPGEKLVTLVMIQNFNPEVQRAFDNAVTQALLD
ncbi:MAG: serine hydrolase [Acidobacteria bacterium]|nr:serine hydrolase [Acidobacteriota bacterium]